MTSKIEKAYKFYGIYTGLMLHFKPGSSYKYNKYGPRQPMKPEKFEEDSSRFAFLGFVTSFKENEEDFEEYIKLYGFREGKVPYFRALTDRSILEEFNEYKKTFKYSFDYNFDILLSELSLSYFKTNGQDLPKIVEDLYSGDLYPRIFVLFDRALNLMNKYSSIFKDDLLFQSRLESYKRYEEVTVFQNQEKYIELVKKTVKTKT